MGTLISYVVFRYFGMTGFLMLATGCFSVAFLYRIFTGSWPELT